MILLLRVFGVFAAIGTLIYAIALIVTLTTPSYGAYVAAPAVYLAISAGFTWLWFWLAAKLSKRRHQAWMQRMALPCQQCGSRAAIGYHICSTCGRVKAAGV